MINTVAYPPKPWTVGQEHVVGLVTKVYVGNGIWKNKSAGHHERRIGELEDRVDGLTLAEAVARGDIDELLGARIWFTDRQAWFEVILTAEVVPSQDYAIQSTANSDYSFKLSSTLLGSVTLRMFGVDTANEDNTAYLQAFFDYLPNNPYVLPSLVGEVIATHTICPSLDGFKLDFSGVTFKVKDGHNPLDNELIRFNSLKNGIVIGLHTDGNRNNVPDVADDTSYGRVLNWRLGNSSENVEFYNTKMSNALYCGTQWGKDINNIWMYNTTFDNIGEHVFYISGTGGGNNKNIHWRGINGTSYGISTNNSVGNHECSIIKSAQTVGDNDNWTVHDVVATQPVAPDFANVVINNGALRKLELKNVRVGKHISSVIYPTGNAYYVEIDGVEQIQDAFGGSGTRLIYSHTGSGLVMREYTAKDVKLFDTFEHTNIQMFDKIEDSTLGRCNTSAIVSGEYTNDDRQVKFINTRFVGVFFPRHVDHNFVFTNCDWTEPQANAIANVGLSAYTAGKWIKIHYCTMTAITGNTVTFDAVGGVSGSTDINLEIIELKGGNSGLPPLNMLTATSLNRVKIDGYQANAADNPLGDVAANYMELESLVKNDLSRDWARYTNSWTVATGNSSIGFDLSAVLARTPTRDEVSIAPQANPAGAGVSQYWFEISGSTVTIYTDVNTTIPLTFTIKVELK